jgi:hypothetical protein
MTCAECLHAVATADVAELRTAGALVAHCRTCADCAALVDDVAEETRRIADALNGVPAGVHPHVLAARAVAGAARSRRRADRLRGAWYAVGGGAALLVFVAVMRAIVALPRDGPAGDLRTVELRCLGPVQATELARGFLPYQVQARPGPAGTPTVLLGGPGALPHELAAAAATIARLDDEYVRERPQLCAAVPNAFRGESAAWAAAQDAIAAEARAKAAAAASAAEAAAVEAERLKAAERAARLAEQDAKAVARAAAEAARAKPR